MMKLQQKQEGEKLNEKTIKSLRKHGKDKQADALAKEVGLR